MGSHEEKFEGVTIDYNYRTLKDSADNLDAILIEKDDEWNDDCISVTTEEARWIAKKLLEFADKIDEIRSAVSAVPDIFYFKIPSDRSDMTYKCIKKADNACIVYWNYDTKNVPFFLLEVKERLADGRWKIVKTEDF